MLSSLKICAPLMGLMAFLTSVSGDSCPWIDGCSFTASDCTAIRCTTRFMDNDITEEIKLDTCKKDITATVKITALGKTFSHVFTSEGDVSIPGLDFGPLGKVYFRFKLTKDSSNEIHLKVSLALKLFSFGKSITVIDEEIGEAKSCGVFAWLNDQPAGVQAGVYGGGVVLFLLIVFAIVACCKCCHTTQSPGAIVVQPAAQMQMEVAVSTAATKNEPAYKLGQYAKF